MGDANEPRPALTGPQQDILQFIRTRCRETGVPPSYREIQHHFGYRAVGTVQDHIRALRRKGYVERPKVARAARNLLPREQAFAPPKRLAVYGEIAAGSARQAEQVEIGSIFIAEGTFKGTCFALRVVGDSMVDVGIFEGDLLVVEKQNIARSGDIIVALVNGETTVKRYIERGGAKYLYPENQKLQPIPIKDVEFSIQGKVVGLQRRM